MRQLAPLEPNKPNAHKWVRWFDAERLDGCGASRRSVLLIVTVRDSTPSLWPSLRGHCVCNTCTDLGLGFCDSVFVYLHLSPSFIIDAETIWQATTNSSAKSTSGDESRRSSRDCGRRRVGCWKSGRRRQRWCRRKGVVTKLYSSLHLGFGGRLCFSLFQLFVGYLLVQSTLVMKSDTASALIRGCLA